MTSKTLSEFIEKNQIYRSDAELMRICAQEILRVAKEKSFETVIPGLEKLGIRSRRMETVVYLSDLEDFINSKQEVLE